MPSISQRDALATLTVSRLREIAASFELELPSRAAKEALVEALARSRRAPFERVLGLLSRQELKAICRAAGLDDSGREKAKIVDRLLGRLGGRDGGAVSGSPAAPAGNPGPGAPPPPRPPQQLPLPGRGRLTQQQLERHLWGAADVLRGKIDSSDYKHYIFGLLFFKRLCDVWQEEYEERLATYGDPALAAHPDEHRFAIPEGAFWRDVRRHTTNIGERLNAAFAAIEDANLRLRGIFQDVDFNNKERFPDATLELLLQHFESLDLRKSQVEADMLGNAYEYLIAQFADDAGKKGGEFYTPKPVVRLIVECLAPADGMSVYDPACGSGGMLLEAVHYLERQGGNPKSLRLYGQEMNLNTWAICKMNLFLHDIDDAFVERGDVLRTPRTWP